MQNVKSTTIAVRGNLPSWEQDFMLWVLLHPLTTLLWVSSARESRLHPLSIPSSHFSLKLTNALVFFLSSLLSYFLSTLTPSPFSSLPHQALLIPVFHTAHPHCIHTSTTSSSSCAVPRHPCLAFSQHLLPLFCLFILRFLLDLHFLSMTSTPTYTPPPPPPRIWTSGYTIYCHRLVILLFSRTN